MSAGVRSRTSMRYQSVVKILQAFEKLVHEILRLCLAQLGVRVADDVGKEIPAGAKL